MRDTGIGQPFGAWILSGGCGIDDLPVQDGKQLALVMEVDGLARVGEEDGMAVCAARLHGLDGVVALGDGIRPVGRVRVVERVNLLPQNRALERADGFAGFFDCEV